MAEYVLQKKLHNDEVVSNVKLINTYFQKRTLSTKPWDTNYE